MEEAEGSQPISAKDDLDYEECVEDQHDLIMDDPDSD